LLYLVKLGCKEDNITFRAYIIYIWIKLDVQLF
jgi:hypothetical protein